MKLWGQKSGANHLARGTMSKKTKIIVLAGICVLALALVITAIIRAGIKPPDVLDIPDDPVEDSGTAFHTAEPHPEDEYIGGGKVAPEGVTNDHRKKDFYTFLVVGTDNGVNTDTIMVVSYDAANKEANLISIPRDSLVNVKRSVKKINAAYANGRANGGSKEDGVAQLQREIKTIIGFVPDSYVVVDLKAFVDIVDTVGGVAVDVPYYMYYFDPNEGLEIDIPKGENKLLDGKTALKFARYRTGIAGVSRTISDYDRIKNQQTVIKSLVNSLFKIENVPKIPKLISIVNENVFTDLSLLTLEWLRGELSEMQGTDALHTFTMPTVEGGSGPPKYYEYLDAEKVLELVNNTINPFTVDITADDVDIINSEP